MTQDPNTIQKNEQGGVNDKSIFPESDTEGRKGKVSVTDKGGYYAVIKSHHTLKKIAAKIAKQVVENTNQSANQSSGQKINNKNIIIIDQLDILHKAQLWGVIDRRLSDFLEKFKNLEDRIQKIGGIDGSDAVKTSARLANFKDIPQVLGGLSDIAGFFRVDTTIIGREVNPEINVLIAEVAKQLKLLEWNVHLPKISISDSSELLFKITKLVKKRSQIAKKQIACADSLKKKLSDRKKQLPKSQQELQKLEQATPPDKDAIAKQKQVIVNLNKKISDLQKSQKQLDALEEEITDLLTVFDAYLKSITERTADKPSQVEAVAIIDYIKNKKDAELLYLDIVSQGAEIHVTEKIWTFARIHYMGGSVCVYFLTNFQGEYKSSGSITEWKGESFTAGLCEGIEQLNQSDDTEGK